MLTNGSQWSQLHPLSSQDLLLTDRYGGRGEDILVNFGPAFGLWQFSFYFGWQQLHGMSPEGLAAGEFH